MSYINVYPSRIDWENEPSISTPINATNLNKMDYALYSIDGTLATWDTTKANQSDLLLCVKTITYDTDTGVFVFTWQNGTTSTVDLNIEKIPVSFSMDANGVITMTTDDGTTYTADVGSLIKTYTFTDSSEIDFTVTTDASGNKTVTAGIVAGSIDGTKLTPNYLADCQAARTAAGNSATAADNSAEDAESWAVGTRDGSPVPSTDPAYHNNAKWYSEQANPTALANLTDVDIALPTNGQVLTYNSTSQKWENAEGGGSTPSADQVSYDNTTSGMSAEDVQEAIDEIDYRVDTIEANFPKLSNAVSVLAGATSATITDAAILTTSVVEPFIDDGTGDAIAYTSVTVTTRQAVVAFDALANNASVKVRITN